ncbi:MAG TPA: DUF1592 domain-containing protein [Polyangiaceae bacterium]|nr:DUF1592 domain-containing protein [Polyangiaceae bacterium]
MAVLALAVACGHTAKRNEQSTSSTGGVGGSVGGGGFGDGGFAGGGEVVEPCAPNRPPPEAPLRALREAQLSNELEVFGESLEGEVFPEPFSQLYDRDPEPQANLQFVRGHGDFVADLARRVVMNADGLGELLGCKVAPEPANDCQSRLFDFVIRRLFRGRQEPDTRDELEQVFAKGEALGGGFQSGARAVLEVALQAPEFLYRVEQGQPATELDAPWGQPTDVEMASRLSFLFWDRGPDDELLALAETPGSLTNDRLQIEKQARRLLDDERSRGPVRRFYRELMQASGALSFDPELPEFDADILALMDQEFASFVEHATFDGASHFGALFEPVTWVNGPLARFYGWPGIEGDQFREVQLQGGSFAGLLTQPAWLSRASFPRYSNPSRRGWVVTRALRCQDIPPEPLNDVPPPTMAGMTSRGRAAVHAANAACAACHSFVDPVGFGLEHFDATGRYRETENGLPIDASGTLAPSGEPFDGAGSLAEALLSSDDTRNCFVTQWSRFAFGRTEEEANECTRATLRDELARNDSIYELLVALTQSNSFLFRKQSGGQP